MDDVENIKAKVDLEIIKEIEGRMEEYSKIVEENSNWKIFPIKKLVQLPLLVLFETINALNRNNE